MSISTPVRALGRTASRWLAAATLSAIGFGAGATTLAGTYELGYTRASAWEDWFTNEPAATQLPDGSFYNAYEGAEVRVAPGLHRSTGIDDPNAPHWNFGPHTDTTTDVRLSMGGTPGQITELTAKVGVWWNFALTSPPDMHAIASFEVNFYGNNGPGSQARGNLQLVNCVGCGGFIGTQTYDYTVQGNYSHGTWGVGYMEFDLVSSFITDVGNEGRFQIYSTSEANHTSQWLNIALLSLTNQSGQSVDFESSAQAGQYLVAASVPEPESAVLLLAGSLLLLPPRQRRR